ncbi:hypothetical protein U5B43_01155 [Campylobacter sp. 9BO]|uniref:hypothetical protein n=1 Tax=Campylobacter sp. 9BO TaxID=3424759 RepID=UPI003D32A294
MGGEVAALLLSGCAKAGLNTPIQNHTNTKFQTAFALCKDGEYNKQIETKLN